MGWDKCIVIYIHHYNIIQSIFTSVKILYALLILLSHFSPLEATDLFIVYLVLSFPECHVDGIMLYVACSDWLLSLSNIHLSFLHVLSWLDSSFIFSTEYYSIVWMDHSLFIHSPTEGILVASKFRQL